MKSIMILLILNLVKFAKRKWRIIIILSIAAVYLLIHVRNHSATATNLSSNNLRINNTTLVAWATPIMKNYESTRFCGTNVCTFTNLPERLTLAKALLFYGSNIEVNQFPLPRTSNQIWALLHEESPRNKPYLMNVNVIKHFNFTSTFSQYSDMPLTTQYLPNLNNLTSPKFLVPIGEKSRLRQQNGLAPIVFLQSNCDTMSGRDEYVRELMQYVDVDSFGSCLNNRELPKNLKQNYLESLYSSELLAFLGRYKFVIAYENGICDDYITEKFWRPLIIGAIPIYYGSPTIKDWQPNRKSIINIADFSGPKDLAAFINQLDKNDTKYNEYLQHKYNVKEPIKNKKLLHDLKTREVNFNDEHFFGAFECFVCTKVNEHLHLKIVKQASIKHYNCPLPPIYPAMNSTVSNNWKSILDFSKIQATAIADFLERNLPFTKSSYDKKIDELLNN